MTTNNKRHRRARQANRTTTRGSSTDMKGYKAWKANMEKRGENEYEANRTTNHRSPMMTNDPTVNPPQEPPPPPPPWPRQQSYGKWRKDMERMRREGLPPTPPPPVQRSVVGATLQVLFTLFVVFIVLPFVGCAVLVAVA